jgi:hypothetical protein
MYMYSKIASALLISLVAASSIPANAQSATERLRNKTMDAANNSNSPANAANAVNEIEKNASSANGGGTHAGGRTSGNTAGNHKKTSKAKAKNK